MDYNSIKSLELECTCVGIGNRRWDKLMLNAVRGNSKRINQLVKKFLPDLYKELSLDLYNPYHYYRTNTHLILVHSSVEYFLKFNMEE